MPINLTITEENEPPISVTITEGIGLTTGGGSTTVIDDLTSTSATSALSANQGRVLDEGKASTASVTTVASNLTTHENDTTNPHSVTASQAGAVSYSVVQSLTDLQKSKARTNIDGANTGTDGDTFTGPMTFSANTEWDATATFTLHATAKGLLQTALGLSTLDTPTFAGLELNGAVGSGTWQGTAIADAYIASAATWNAKAPGTVVTDYIGAAATITSSSGLATPNAASGRSQKFPLTENVTLFNVPINLADGQSMLITVLQDSTQRSMSFAAGYTLIGSGVAADIAALTSGQYAWLTISRYGTDYLLAITTEP